MRAAIAVVIAMSAGCASSARYMFEVKPSQRIMAPPDQAMIVFVRPSKMAWAISANIIDEQGRFLGDIPAKGHFAIAVPPGQHMFVVWAENTDAMVATVAAGHIYFVQVNPSMGAFSAHMHLRAIKPSLPNWMEKDQWMLNSTQFTVDQPGGQANLYRKGQEAVQERLRRGQEHLQKYSPQELFERTLGPGDGI